MVAGKRYYGGEDYGEEAREFRELIKEMFEYGGASNPADFIPILEWFDYQGLVKRAQSQPDYYTDEIIKGLIIVMLLAATDTSAVTLEWAMSIFLDVIPIFFKVDVTSDIPSDACYIKAFELH
ncbi:hypothetical protein Q3G72_012593 [Acer saccharum]|nr:hypothetical protein Q3G72_012593 [Acer saccharum]